MSTADITISHPGFQTQAQNTVRSLWKDEDFADVPLASVDDKQVKAHKAVLSSCSPFFKNILLKNPHQSPLLYLGNLHSSQLKQVQNLSSNIIDTNDKFRSCGSFITASATSPRTSSPSSLKPASCSGFPCFFKIVFKIDFQIFFHKIVWLSKNFPKIVRPSKYVFQKSLTFKIFFPELLA